MTSKYDIPNIRNEVIDHLEEFYPNDMSRFEKSESILFLHNDEASDGGEGETEEQYDARLEREETERLAAQRKIHLEHMKRAQEDVPTKNGVRFKGMASNSYIPNVVSILNSSIGRGRMKYLDPELRRD